MKTVLITGASRGIGFVAARLFAESGYKVFANYNKTDSTLPALSKELAERGFLLIPVFGDVSKKEDVEKLFAECGEVDVLINNAGISEFSQFIDISEEAWDKMLDVNLKSVYLCSLAAAPAMISKKQGRIINISSVWGVTGGSCEVHYSASKAGIIGLTKALAKELGPSGITVNAIAPGVIETDMCADLTAADIAALCDETPLGKIGKPEDVAKTALFLAESGFITGEVINVNGGFFI